MVVPLFGDLAQWLTVEVFWVSHRESPKLFRTSDSINWTCLACLFSLATLWMCKVRTKKSRVDGIKKTLIYSPSWERKDVKSCRQGAQIQKKNRSMRWRTNQNSRSLNTTLCFKLSCPSLFILFTRISSTWEHQGLHPRTFRQSYWKLGIPSAYTFFENSQWVHKSW